MKTISISATVGVGINKQDCGTVEREFPTGLSEISLGEWKPEGYEKPITGDEALDMIRRSFTIDVQRTMRPKVTNEKAKQMTVLQTKALTDPKLAAMLIESGIVVTPTKDNGLLNVDGQSN